MTASVVQLTAATSDNTNDSQLDVPVINAPAVGNHVLMMGRWNGASPTFTGNGPTDNGSNGGNQWNVRFAPAQAGSLNLFLLDAKIVVNDFTSVSLPGSVATADKAAYAFEVSGLDPVNWFGGFVGPVVILFNGTSRNVQGNTITPDQIGDLIVGCWSNAGESETSLTSTSPFTNLPAATGSGYYSGAGSGPGIWVEGSYLVAPDVTARQPLATGGAAPGGYGAFAALYRTVRGQVLGKPGAALGVSRPGFGPF